jgi:dGTPase
MTQSLYKSKDFEREHKITFPKNLPPEDYRSNARSDYARLIHSAAFRRLQGKTQLFPGVESDFFRNRLTHSLEVAQIASSIAIKFNNTVDYFRRFPLDIDILNFAGCAHDLGHPPFGHIGESALDDCMKTCGGFEGNAQTLRILARLEKKEYLPVTTYGIADNGQDRRIGLNLSYRALASILKYDRQIPARRSRQSGLVKGYYKTEAEIVSRIREAVVGDLKYDGPLKTIECQIMDFADDIAYSTYDLEDALKAGFTTPLRMISSPDLLLQRVATQVQGKVGSNIGSEDVVTTLLDIFLAEGVFDLQTLGISKDEVDFSQPMSIAGLVARIHRSSETIGSVAFLRTRLTSHLVGEFIRAVTVEVNDEAPAFSKVSIDEQTLRKIEVLKNFTYESLIMSPRLKISEYRGTDIVSEIFRALSNENTKGQMLLPNDFQAIYNRFSTKSDKARVICDFVAGMTDRYAVEFYGRLKSENPQTIFKPL